MVRRTTPTWTEVPGIFIVMYHWRNGQNMGSSDSLWMARDNSTRVHMFQVMSCLSWPDRLSRSQPRHWYSCGFWAVMEHAHTALRTVTKSNTHVQMRDGWIDYRGSVFGQASVLRITRETSQQQQDSLTSKANRALFLQQRSFLGHYTQWYYGGVILPLSDVLMDASFCLMDAIYINIYIYIY